MVMRHRNPVGQFPSWFFSGHEGAHTNREGGPFERVPSLGVYTTLFHPLSKKPASKIAPSGGLLRVVFYECCTGNSDVPHTQK